MMGSLLCSTDAVKGAVVFVPVPGDACGGREKTVEEGQLSGDNLVIFRSRMGGVSRKDFLAWTKSVGGGRGSCIHVTTDSGKLVSSVYLVLPGQPGRLMRVYGELRGSCSGC